MHWPRYLIERAIRQAPDGCNVVPGSTPVVSFGNPLAAVATLGINPSSAEFLTAGRLLEGSKRRLATMASLGARVDERLSPEQATRVVDDCATYFERMPYKKWFGPLDLVLQETLGLSYWKGDACHLDLIQWATDPVWQNLTPNARDRLLLEDEPFLLEQLNQPNLKLVLVNGRTALAGVQKAGVVQWHVDQVVKEPGITTFTLYQGKAEGCTFFAWSLNLQSSHATVLTRPRLINLLRTKLALDAGS